MLKITEIAYECILTNLAAEDFPAEEIKKLYGLRWGIERSFRELKYTIGLANFHAKKVEYILQEIFARLTLYNFCERIITKIAIKQKNGKHSYQINFTVAILICSRFFRGRISPREMEALIRKMFFLSKKGERLLEKSVPTQQWLPI